MHQQKFVTVLDFDDKEGFAGAFERFMWNVRDQRQLEPQIKSFVKANLSPTAVYLRLCIEIGVCRPEAANLIHELVDEQLPGQTAGADLSSV